MIRGITFDKQLMKSYDLAHQVHAFMNGHMGITKGFETSYVNGALEISEGYAIVYGRLLSAQGYTGIETAGYAQPYCRLVLEIDLSKENTVNEFNQAQLKVLNGASYPTLIQENLDEDGTIYQLPLAKFEANDIEGTLTDDRLMLGMGSYALQSEFNELKSKAILVVD